VTGETLRSWVRQDDEHAGRGHSHGEQNAESRDGELARLRAENGRLRKAEKEWELEREILRRAAAYFAKEMK
jgi:transposase